MLPRKWSSFWMQLERPKKILTSLHFQRLGFQFLDHSGTHFCKPRAVERKRLAKRRYWSACWPMQWLFCDFSSFPGLMFCLAKMYAAATCHCTGIFSVPVCYNIGTEFFSNHVPPDQEYSHQWMNSYEHWATLLPPPPPFGTKQCSARRGMPLCIPCGHTLGRVLVSINITACEFFNFNGDIWQFSIILQNIHTFLGLRNKKKKKHCTLNSLYQCTD